MLEQVSLISIKRKRFSNWCNFKSEFLTSAVAGRLHPLSALQKYLIKHCQIFHLIKYWSNIYQTLSNIWCNIGQISINHCQICDQIIWAIFCQTCHWRWQTTHKCRIFEHSRQNIVEYLSLPNSPANVGAREVAQGGTILSKIWTILSNIWTNIQITCKCRRPRSGARLKEKWWNRPRESLLLLASASPFVSRIPGDHYHYHYHHLYHYHDHHGHLHDIQWRSNLCHWPLLPWLSSWSSFSWIRDCH